MSSQLTPTTTLLLPNSSTKIPALGFGVYLSHGDTCLKSCATALESGYRHIDTAQYYANESQVGQAIHSSSIPRKEVFLTTKILTPCAGPEETYKSVRESVEKLDEGGYVDLFLIHNATVGAENVKTMWQAMEKLQKEGRSKAIGVSNFGIGHIEAMKKYAEVWPPAVNQLEVSSFLSVVVADFRGC